MFVRMVAEHLGGRMHRCIRIVVQEERELAKFF